MHTLSFLRPAIRRGSVLVILAVLAGAGSAHAQRSGVCFSIGVNVPAGGREFYHGADRYYAYRGDYYRWNSGAYYRCPPPRGYFIESLPPRYERVVIGSNVYYRTEHAYYRPMGSRYEIVEVPVVVEERTVVRPKSSAVTRVPASDEMVSVWLDDQRHLLDDGQYFKTGSQGCVWVAAPVGAKLKTLPIGANTVWHEETEYFEFDGGYFRRTPDGFKVVVAPWAPNAESKDKP